MLIFIHGAANTTEMRQAMTSLTFCFLCLLFRVLISFWISRSSGFREVLPSEGTQVVVMEVSEESIRLACSLVMSVVHCRGFGIGCELGVMRLTFDGLYIALLLDMIS